MGNDLSQVFFVGISVYEEDICTNTRSVGLPRYQASLGGELGEGGREGRHVGVYSDPL